MKKFLGTLTSCVAGLAAMAQVNHTPADFVNGPDVVSVFGGPVLAKNSPCYYNGLDTTTLSGKYTGTGAITLTNNKQYLLRGFCYIGSGVILKIEPGTVIFGEKPTTGTLIIEQGGQLKAKGKFNNPVVFTSCQPAGQRAAGDWGGLVIADQGVTSCGSNLILEGGAVGNKSKNPPDYEVVYGGSNGTRNSGAIRFVRIEFPGVAIKPNEEINGFTFAAVGNRTTVDHIQISYSADDAAEWFGGKVNFSYLVTLGTEDDDIDTDYGYRGAGIFGLVVRDPQIANTSGSYAFESSSTTCPNGRATRPNFANFTVIGPDYCSLSGNSNYKYAAQWKKGSEQAIYNSLLAGFPGGVQAKDPADISNFQTSKAQFKHNVLSGISNANGLLDYDPAALPTYNGTLKGGAATNQSFARTAIKFKGTTDGCYGINNPKEYTIKAVSPLRKGQVVDGIGWDTTNTRWQAQSGFTSAQTNIKDNIGAFKSYDWINSAGQGDWVNFDPNNTVYSPPMPFAARVQEDNLSVYPNPLNSSAVANVQFLLEQEGKGKVEVYDYSGRIVKALSKEFNRGFNVVELDASSLSEGAYIVKVVTSTATQTEKIFIRK